MIQILSGVGLFFLGIMVGAVFHRSFQGETSKNKRLEQKLAELQDTHSRYKAEVSEHFMDTAKAVQTLNNSYRDVHAQLAKGANRLCNDDNLDVFLSINTSAESAFTQGKNTTENPQITDSQHYAPPMDYAPKDTPDAEGTLSEHYGLTDAKVESRLNKASSQDELPAEQPTYEPTLSEKERKKDESLGSSKQTNEQARTS